MSKDWQAAKSPAASKRHVQFAGTWKEFVAVTGAIVLLMTVMVTAASGPRKGEVAASASNLFGTVFGIYVVTFLIRVGRRRRNHADRQKLISETSASPQGLGTFIVQLPFVLNPPWPVMWPNCCIGCGVNEAPYHRGGFEFSNLGPGSTGHGKISTETRVRRGWTTYAMTISYQVPICDACAKTHRSRYFVHLRIAGDYQYFVFGRPEAASGPAPIEYGVRFRKQNSDACYVCGHCGEPIPDDAQTCRCGMRQPARGSALAKPAASKEEAVVKQDQSGAGQRDA